MVSQINTKSQVTQNQCDASDVIQMGRRVRRQSVIGEYEHPKGAERIAKIANDIITPVVDGAKNVFFAGAAVLLADRYMSPNFVDEHIRIPIKEITGVCLLIMGVGVACSGVLWHIENTKATARIERFNIQSDTKDAEDERLGVAFVRFRGS